MASSTPKVMSTRLAGMKFMQRSAAKASPSEPSTPNGPPSKRIRLSNGTSAPGTPGTPSDHEVIQSAIAAEEKRRQDALDKANAQSGETKWVLSFKDPQDGSRVEGMQVVHAGFAAIDAEDDESDEEVRPARMQFGGGVKKKVAQKASRDSDDSEEESESTSEYDSDDPTAELIRETKREAAAKAREDRKAQKTRESQPIHETPRRPTMIDEDADLGGLTTLSGGRSGGGARDRDNSDRECYHCKQKGHIKSECPKMKKKSSSGNGNGNRGSRGFRR